MEIQKIQSFTVDHDKLEPGLYISRVDGTVTTYDLRTRKPNAGDYMDNLTMHSVEHLFATYIRSSSIGSKVLYFGPMGCQTGFYLLVDSTPKEQVLEAIEAVLRQIIAHTGPVFGAARIWRPPSWSAGATSRCWRMRPPLHSNIDERSNSGVQPLLTRPDAADFS